MSKIFGKIGKFSVTSLLVFELFFSGLFILVYLLKKITTLPIILNSDLFEIFFSHYHFYLPIAFLALLIGKYIRHESIEKLIREDIFSIITFLALLITSGDAEFCFWLTSTHLLSSIIGEFIYKFEKSNRPKAWSSFSNLGSSKVIFIFFSLLVLLGAFLLMLPMSSNKGQALDFADALFMSSSAVSTTGLATISLPDDLSLFGQIVMLILVQIGALGLMTIFSLIVFFYGKTLRLQERLLLQDLLDAEHMEDLLVLLRNIVVYTFIIEIWGGIILSVVFLFEGFDIGRAIYHGFFHSVSAFCTAGFSTFGNSLENFKTNELINITTSILAILGALGFIVIYECTQVINRQKKLSSISLHSKVVLAANFILLLGGTSFIFFNEFFYSLDRYGLWDKIQISFFQFMTTTTTAGFNTIPIGELQSSTLFFLLPVMFIGGAPGSTAGGIKITSLVIIVYSMKSFFSNRGKIHIYNRSIPFDVIIKTTAIMIISFFVIVFFIFLMMFLEPNQSFLVLTFEVLSSFGTVGLSAGVTPYLTVGGKIALALLMLIARIGPLTLVLAINRGGRSSEGQVETPESFVLIG